MDPKKRFRNVREAISSNRRQVKEDIMRHYCTILPRMRRFDFDKLSPAEMESKQIQIITELDELRQVDANTGNFCSSEVYISLEMKLLLLLEASDCIAQKAYVECLDISLDDETDNNACLSFTAKRKHSSRPQNGLISVYIDSKRLNRG